MSRGDQIASSGLGRLFRGQTAVDFYGLRRVGLIIAVVVGLATVGSLFTRGLDLGLDFEGGDAWDIPASQTFGVDEAKAVLEDNDVPTNGARIQRRSSDTTDLITVQIEEVTQNNAEQITAAFADAAGVAT
ncbi:MAG: preprotein translocase subunit SecF, partial [Ilumatobacter sp.]